MLHEISRVRAQVGTAPGSVQACVRSCRVYWDDNLSHTNSQVDKKSIVTLLPQQSGIVNLLFRCMLLTVLYHHVHQMEHADESRYHSDLARFLRPEVSIKGIYSGLWAMTYLETRYVLAHR